VKEVPGFGMDDAYLTLSRRENQARGIGQYAIDYVAGKFGEPGEAALARVEQFHVDSVACAVGALADGMNAPQVLRQEAMEYAERDPRTGAVCFGSATSVKVEKAIVANCAAVRELDANGTNFGYNPRTGYMRGEFGHNDFYPVVITAAGMAGLDGRSTLRAMLLLDEIRGRLAEVFALKDYKIDHVVHGAIASAAVYGAMLGATAEQIESAIGMTVAHYIPFRAIRAGHQLSDSKGASAAISAEAAVLAMQRAMRGFIGPADIFRNPQAIFCLFEPPEEPESSPFDLTLTTTGDDFAVMGMHFKLGLYEHQSAGAIQGVIDLLSHHPGLLDDPESLRQVRIKIYQPAFGIIGDAAKRDPRTRQSADHSMVYIIATLLRKAHEARARTWEELMLLPEDYDEAALFHPLTRRLMEKIVFLHGGAEYDARYPDGIPTTVELEHGSLGVLSSGLLMYPEGHARSTSGNLERLLQHKFQRLALLGVEDPESLYRRVSRLAGKSPQAVRELYAFPIRGLR
jgi:2-methylcitrate dehydratase